MAIRSTSAPQSRPSPQQQQQQQQPQQQQQQQQFQLGWWWPFPSLGPPATNLRGTRGGSLPPSPAYPSAKRSQTAAAGGVAFWAILVAFPLYFLTTCQNTHRICSPFSSETRPWSTAAPAARTPNEGLLDEALKGSRSGNYSDPFRGPLPERIQNILRAPWRGGAAPAAVPVVLMYPRGGSLPCTPTHFVARVLKQARRHNRVVHFMGPEECSALASDLDISLSPFSEYRDVVAWFQNTLGQPVFSHVRWYILRAFMERHAYPRVFYMDTDVLLFANVTDLTGKLFRKVPVSLSVRWPSLRSPGPSQYASTSVSGHVALWTHEALCDFLDFHQLFLKAAVLFGEPGDRSLVTNHAYSDMVILGWYTYKICWTKKPEDLHPQCIADRESGVTPERSARLRDKFVPKYRVESFAAPRWCAKSDYVDRGWCVMDHGFSVQSPKQFFKFRPEEGMKCPTSMHYTFFEDWSKDQEEQTTKVQFLAVHFQAHKKGYLERGDDPATTWGSNAD